MDNITPHPAAVKPQRPVLDLRPFHEKDPAVILARLERENTVLADRLTDAETALRAWVGYAAELERYVAALEAPPTEPGPEPDLPRSPFLGDTA